MRRGTIVGVGVCAAVALLLGAACGDPSVGSPKRDTRSDAAAEPEAKTTPVEERGGARPRAGAAPQAPVALEPPKRWERAVLSSSPSAARDAEVAAQVKQEDLSGAAAEDPAGVARLQSTAAGWNGRLADEVQSAAVVAEMRAALTGSDFWEMRAALAVLMRDGRSLLAAELRAEITPLLRHAEGGTRFRAAKLIGSLGATQAEIDAVLEQARSPDFLLRWAAPRLLVAIGGDRPHPDVDEALARLMRDERPEVASDAIAALRTLAPGPATSRTLASMASDPGATAETIRRLASLEVKDRALVEALVRAAQTDPPQRALAALAALENGVQSEERALVADAARTVVSSRASAQMRIVAVRVLAAAAGAAAVPELRRLADDRSEPPELRATAGAAADSLSRR